mmetsp:Transcript_35408/g.92650  ORF Transcript_35408/g.92650 Transcript_35408/m.92650 type:complete len:567 (+) Transcript_35408:231-1931(+)
MGKLTAGERRLAVGLIVVVGLAVAGLQFQAAVAPSAGGAHHTHANFRQRLALAEGATADLRRQLAECHHATGQPSPPPAEVATAKAEVASLTAELASVRKALSSALSQIATLKAESAAGPPAAAHEQPRAFHERVYPAVNDERLPFVGDVLPMEGSKGGGVEKAVLLGESEAIADGNASSCQYIDVVFQRQGEGRCTLVVDQGRQWHNGEDEKKRGFGWFGKGFASASTMSFTMNTTAAIPTPLREMIPREKWLDWIQTERDNLLLPFLTNKADVIKAAKALIGVGAKVPGTNNSEPLLVMCANHGHWPLLLNFFCSLRAANLPTPRHFIVATSTETAQMLTALGLTAFYHPGLGEFPTQASHGYGDTVFVRMMMLKQFAVYIALLCRYDVLFQDVDLTWSRDPVPHLQAESEYYHAQFMDDGARNFLNAPYMANSGFFYLRSDFLSFKFWDAVTMNMLIGPNQRIVARVLEQYTGRYGLRVRTLPWQRYVNGKHLLTKRKRETVEEILAESEVLHFSWTLNIEDKYNKMKVHDAVHISRECYFNVSQCDTAAAGGDQWRDKMCVA